MSKRKQGINKGDLVVCEINFPNDWTNASKHRPVVVLGEIPRNHKGPVAVVPLSCSSMEFDNILIEANDSNGLHRDSSAVTSQCMVVDSSMLDGKTMGNVGDTLLSCLIDALGMSGTTF